MNSSMARQYFVWVYVPVNSYFSVMLRLYLGRNQHFCVVKKYYEEYMCLAEGHNTAAVRL